MDYSLEPGDKVDPPAGGRDDTAVTAGPAHLLMESEYQDLDDRSRLGTGLASIASRLVRQLAIGGGPDPYSCANRDQARQRDMRAGLVPRDDSPLVAWHRVVAISRGGSILVMVGLPASTRLDIAEPPFAMPRLG
jgi:hypothetical protein